MEIIFGVRIPMLRRDIAHSAQPTGIVGENTKARTQGRLNRKPLDRAVVGAANPVRSLTSPAGSWKLSAGPTHAIAHTGFLPNSIVSHLREKDKAHNDVPQLQRFLQTVRERSKGAAAIPLPSVSQDLL